MAQQDTPAAGSGQITEASAAAAFAEWETACRQSPFDFLTAEEILRMTVADLSTRSAIYFMAMLRKVGAGSGQTPEQKMREFMDHEFSRQSVGTTPGPWYCRADNSLLDEPHYQVVNPVGIPLFDSINRSPVADEATEQADMQLASAAPLMFAALLVAREFINTERGAWVYEHTQSDGTLDEDTQPVLDDIDQLLKQVDSAMAAAIVMGSVTA